MCCFSRPVQSVSATKIFSRDAGNGKQFLVYSMTYRAGEDLAMVLPLPTPPEATLSCGAFWLALPALAGGVA